MKIKKMIILFLLSFIVFNIGLIKGKAWSCTYELHNGNGEFKIKPTTTELSNVVSFEGLPLIPYGTKIPVYEITGYTVARGSSAAAMGQDSVKFSTPHNYSDDNSCLKYIFSAKYGEKTPKTTYYVTTDTDPKYFYDKDPDLKGAAYTYVGKIKSQTSNNNETKDPVHQGSSLDKTVTDGYDDGNTTEEKEQDESLTQKTLSCGSIDYIPGALPYFTNNLYRVVKWLVPIILILMGTIDFVRAIISQDENRMKESPRRFFRRLIAAVVVFFVLAIIQFVINVVNATGKSDLMECVDCFINDSDKCKNGSTINISEGTKLENESTTQETPTSSKTPSKSISPYSNTTKKKSTTKSKSTSKSSSKSKSNSKSKSKK